MYHLFAQSEISRQVRGTWCALVERTEVCQEIWALYGDPAPHGANPPNRGTTQLATRLVSTAESGCWCGFLLPDRCSWYFFEIVARLRCFGNSFITWEFSMSVVVHGVQPLKGHSTQLLALAKFCASPSNVFQRGRGDFSKKPRGWVGSVAYIRRSRVEILNKFYDSMGYSPGTELGSQWD